MAQHEQVTELMVNAAMDAHEDERNACMASLTLPEPCDFYDPRPWRAAIAAALKEASAERDRLRAAMNTNAANGLNAAGEAVELRHALAYIAAREATTLEALGLQARARKLLHEIDRRYHPT